MASRYRPLVVVALLLCAGCSRSVTIDDAGSADGGVTVDANTTAPDAGPAPTYCERVDTTVRCRRRNLGTDAVDDEHTEVVELTFSALDAGSNAVRGTIALVGLFHPRYEVGADDAAEIADRFSAGPASPLVAGHASTTFALPGDYPTAYDDAALSGTLTLEPDGCVEVDVSVAPTAAGGYLYPMTWQGLAPADRARRFRIRSPPVTDGYRDETENLRHRVAQLEKELGEAHETIGRLTGLSSADPKGSDETHNRLLDAPATLRLVRELDHEISEEGLEAIAKLLRERGKLTVQQVGRTLTAPGFSLAVEDGVTRVEWTGDFRGFSTQAVVGSLLGGSFAGLVSFALVHDVLIRTLSEAHTLWMIPVGVGAAFFGFRKMSAELARSRARQQRGTFEAICELAARHRVAAPAKVRVDIEDESGEHELDAEPALAEARSPATPSAEP